MAVPFTQMATEAIYNHSKELSDLISSNIAVVAILGSRGRIEGVTGGLGWKERVFYGTDPNAGHGSAYGEIDTNRLENMTMAAYEPAFFRTSLVINHRDRDMAKGDAALGNLVKDCWEIVKAYAVTKIGTDLHASSQATTNYPIPLPVMVPATLPAAQTGTTRGGIDSAANSWWRSYAYTTAIADLGAVAGLRDLQTAMNAISRSSAMVSKPDFGLTTSALFTRFTSTTEAYRRFTKDDDVAKLGFENVKFGPMTVLWDALCTAKYFYLLNTKKLKIKYLNQEYLQNVSTDEKQLSLPMVITPFVRDTNSANDVALMYLNYQLVCSDLASQGVLSNCTE